MPVEQSQAPRRSRGLEDIAPQYVAKSGLCPSSEAESPHGSLRIRHHHLTMGSPSSSSGGQDEDQARFPRLDQCAHFHYDHVDLPPLQVSLYNEELKALSCDATKCHAVQVRSHGVAWLLRRSYENFKLLDQQLHRCIYDRKFSLLPCLPEREDDDQPSVRELLDRYLARFSQVAGNLINCGPVLNWLELDNRGRRLLVPDNDNCPINTPAVAAAYSVRQYQAQAGDEISFEVGDMISVIDMPPPEESVWWRGKRGFEVGFFPGSCVAVIGDKLPRSLLLPTSVASLTQGCEPSKPVLRKHGKLIAFFRSFILARPSRRRLKQSGILKERVFGCDLGEHLLNSGHQVPMVLKCCAEFIEAHGIVDGIYRLSGVTSNIQKLRNAFDEDRVPALYEDEAILQDIHSVASLLKMYFRELPNPLCTYQLYHAFVGAVGSAPEHKLIRMREAVAKLPPPHYRTLEYLMRHLARVAERGHMTGMTPRNVAIVWAPNLLRCKELEVGGVAALQGVGIQAVVTEFLVCYADLIFCDNLPVVTALPPIQASPKRSRPKSLAISTPTKLLSLEEARTRALNSNTKAETDYIEVGGGPSKLPAKYHTVIELPRKRSSKRSPLGWKSLFGGKSSGRKSSMRKSSTPTELGLHQEMAVTESDIACGRRRLRPVKSAESLNSGANSSRNSAALDAEKSEEEEDSPPAVHQSQASLTRAGHNRSASHDSYFDGLDTPVHSRLSTRPSRLQEMENEDVSSSLDLSEIQLNFDLEDSEMRIFSEDETLVSTSVGSGSIISHNSPRIRKSQLMCVKRLPSREAPPRARPEDPLSACPSLDPSPKKQKTCAATSPTDSTRSKRSRLEEQLASSTGELRFIDSQSPDNTVIVEAEVHPRSAYSLSDTESLDRLTATPDTPVLQYTTLVDLDSNCSTTPSPLTTPSNPAYRALGLSLTPSPSSTSVTATFRDSFAQMSQSSSLDIPYNRLSAPNLTPNSSVGESITPTMAANDNSEILDDVFRYENIPFDTSKRRDYENVPTFLTYQNVPSEKIVIRADVSPLASPVKESLITIRYENVRSPKSSPPRDGDDSGSSVGDRFVYENVDAESLLLTSPDADEFWRGPWEGGHVSLVQVGESPVAEEATDVSAAESPKSNVYQNLPSPLGELAIGDENLYEDIQLPSESLTVQQEISPPPAVQAESPPEVVYQQVKYLRRSIHEINQLLEDVPDPSTTPTCEHSEEIVANIAGEAGPQLLVSSDPDDAPQVSDNGIDSENGCDYPEYENCSVSDSSLLGDESRVVIVGSECNESVESVSGFESENVITDDSAQLRNSIEIVDEECEDLDNNATVTVGEQVLNEDHAINEEQAKKEGCVKTCAEKCERESDASGPFSLLEIVPVGHPLTPENVEGVWESAENIREQSQHCDKKILILDNSNIGGNFETEEPMDKSVTHCLALHVESSLAHSTEELEQSKRRIESEIGRDILRERKMRQELEEVRFSNLGSRRPGSIKDLLSKFETSPTKEMDVVREFHSLTESRSKDNIHDGFRSVTPKLHRRYGDAGSLPPCIRARAAKTARKLANSTSLSISLDGDHFVAANNENQIVRVLTSPDIGKEGLETEPRQESSILKPLNTIDDDPQRRERIERYKEERRMFLREKYRSESFKGERDEIIQRLKQKAGKTLSSPEEPMDTERIFLKSNIRVRCNSFKGSDEPASNVEVEKSTRKKEDGLSTSINDADKKSATSKLDADAVKKERFGDSTLERAKRGVGSEKSRYKCPETVQLEAAILGQGKKPPADEALHRNRRDRVSASPEKPARKTETPITCVLVKERLSSDRMTVTMGLKAAKTKDAERTSEKRYAARGGPKDTVIAPALPTLRSPTRSRLASNPDPSSHKTTLACETTPRPSSIGTTSVERSWKSRTDSGSSEKSVSPTSPSRTQPWGKTANARRADAPESNQDRLSLKTTSARDGGKAPWKTEAKRPSSIETTTPNRRDLSSRSPTESEGTHRKSSGSGSPSYCIRDMAAMFENRDNTKATGRPQGPNKQYLSSM